MLLLKRLEDVLMTTSCLVWETLEILFPNRLVTSSSKCLRKSFSLSCTLVFSKTRPSINSLVNLRTSLLAGLSSSLLSRHWKTLSSFSRETLILQLLLWMMVSSQIYSDKRLLLKKIRVSLDHLYKTRDVVHLLTTCLHRTDHLLTNNSRCKVVAPLPTCKTDKDNPCLTTWTVVLLPINSRCKVAALLPTCSRLLRIVVLLLTRHHANPMSKTLATCLEILFLEIRANDLTNYECVYIFVRNLKKNPTLNKCTLFYLLKK